MFENKLYVCDTAVGMVEVLDLENQTFSYLTKDRWMMNPMNIYVDIDGSKYVADSPVIKQPDKSSPAGAIFVFDDKDNLVAILGRNLNIKPLDVLIRGNRCYITDVNKNQVVVLDKKTGEVITRIGREGQGPGEFRLIKDIALDQSGNIYVTDMLKAQITKFDANGRFVRTFGQLGDNIDEFVRPKGIDIDREGRIWVADAATEVVKILDPQGQHLLFFGLPGNRPGMMNLPAKVRIDYDHVEIFQQYAVPGAELEFLVLVTNQFGLNKINVYGFGRFPETNSPRAVEPVKQPDKTAQDRK